MQAIGVYEPMKIVNECDNQDLSKHCLGRNLMSKSVCAALAKRMSTFSVLNKKRHHIQLLSNNRYVLYLVAAKAVAGQSLMTNLSADYDDGLYAVAVGMNTNLNQ